MRHSSYFSFQKPTSVLIVINLLVFIAHFLPLHLLWVPIKEINNFFVDQLNYERREQIEVDLPEVFDPPYSRVDKYMDKPNYEIISPDKNMAELHTYLRCNLNQVAKGYLNKKDGLLLYYFLQHQISNTSNKAIKGLKGELFVHLKLDRNGTIQSFSISSSALSGLVLPRLQVSWHSKLSNIHSPDNFKQLSSEINQILRPVRSINGQISHRNPNAYLILPISFI